MTYFDAMLGGAGHVFSWPGILIPIAGTLLSMVVSFLPGIGSASLMAVMLVLTLSWDAQSVLLMFGALTGGATFMGSITAILFNIPGGAPSAPALLDGYPLARKGYPRTAIACAATASAVGSVFGVLVLLAMLPVIRPFLLEFGPLERLLLGVWGLTTIVAVPKTPPMKSLAMAAFGLLLAMVGSDPNTAGARWTFGFESLRDGVGPLPALLGLFTLAELAGWKRRDMPPPAISTTAPRDSTRQGMLAVFRHPWITLRSSIIGTLVGIIPGVGGTVAGFLAYGQAAQAARGAGSHFGEGDIRGVIAPEAAVDAKDGGSLLPAVAFGLPGSEAGVILLTVLTIHGLVPGAPMLAEQLPLTMTLIMALLFSNLLTSVVGVLATPALAKLSSLNVDRLALPTLLISVVAIVQMNGSIADFYAAIGFAVLGYVMRRQGWPRVPFVIAFVLGQFIETNLAQSLRLVELQRLDIAMRPASLVLLALIVASMVWMYSRTQSKSTPEGDAARDVIVPALVLAVCLAFAAAALLSDQATSGVAAGVLVASTGLSLYHFIAAWRGAAGPAPLQLAMPGIERRALWALGLLPLVVWLLGLEIALGALVAGWMLVSAAGRLPRGGVALALGVVTTVCAWQLARDAAGLILPNGVLFDLVLSKAAAF